MKDGIEMILFPVGIFFATAAGDYTLLCALALIFLCVLLVKILEVLRTVFVYEPELEETVFE